MNKKMMLLLAAVLLAGCAKNEPPAAQPVETTAPAVRTEIVETAVPTQPDAAPDARRQAYQQLLGNFAENHSLPNEDVPWMDGFGDIENNQFAIADVDGDGQEELVLRFSTAPVAGMCEWVYGFDGTNLSLKLSVFPDTTYYTGGLVEAGWSHNQGLAGEFWPYTLMGYNPAAREYEVIAHVDAWDSVIFPKDFEGNDFPRELDTDNSGILFLVTQGDETETMTKTAYDQWRAALFGSAAPIALDYQNLTAENIAAICG